ncbi:MULTISPECIES: isoprenyl transferase [unclassified Aureispira]|uniref:isoprenyl transferase n=1 Tax=unclassified Aureispira TaxID=2649989 RepID=UPI000695B27D|nr:MULTISPECIES: isoprenyl transferase [unclassified Aureispira]WMX16924.1 isoprenyl transferase [Aureispira sp. CCB-E]
MELKDQIDLNNLPKHVAIIMDGNGRWAKQQGKARVFGHKNGVHSVREVTEAGAELGIQYMTLYAFSTENWNRPKFEVTALMTLLVSTIRKEIATLNKNQIRLQMIGNINMLPSAAQKELLEAIESTKDNTRMTLILALSYSSKWEIIEAVKDIARQAVSGEIAIDDIDEDSIKHALSTKDFPDPELMIRTSGESRISNFLLWQLAYAELFFTPVFWPDFRKKHFYEAILNFQNRERRFGMTSEQITDVST